MTIATYLVSGLTCGGCVTKVKGLLEPYADNVEVTLNPPHAILKNPKQEIALLNKVLKSAGNYELSENKFFPSKTKDPTQLENKSLVSTYYPLLLILAFITMVSFLVQFTPSTIHQTFDIGKWMAHFMAGFFLVFAFFKLLDIKGFAASYAMYDLLAMRVKVYGFIYPFIELALGVFYLLEWNPMMTNSITLVVMLFSSIGVIRSVMNKQKIRCACLGSVFNLPMSTVTIIEDLAMAGMALIMLL